MATQKRFKSLENIYSLMDTSWSTIARKYQFSCTGCRDNCCKSLFFHHTHIEKSYFLYGFSLLNSARKTNILEKAKYYIEKTFSQPGAESQKIMCPANENELCSLYKYRPMICRLHGLPHKICRPGLNPVKGPGCMSGKFQDNAFQILDRTPFYQQMAQVEMNFRSDTGKTARIKETIAQMLLSP